MEDSVVPAHSSGSLGLIAMANNPANQSLRTSFFVGVRIWKKSKKSRPDRWLNCETVLTICSKRVIACELVWKRIRVKTHERATILHLRSYRIEARSPSYQAIVMQQWTMSYPLVALHYLIFHPQRTTWRLNQDESTKRPPRRSSRSISDMHRRVLRGFNRERRRLQQAPENVPTWHKGVAPSLPFMYPTFGATLALHIFTSTPVRGLEDMLSSPLGQHISSYEPVRPEKFQFLEKW